MQIIMSGLCRQAAFPLLLAALAGSSLFAAPPLVTADNFWLPITDEEMQRKAPTVDKNAGMEALFTRVHVADDYTGAFYRISVHYIRLKVFTQEGKDKAATVDIPFDDKTVVTDITGRTVKPDGTIVPLSKDAIHERVTVKLGGLKRKAKSFAMPGVEVGSIIEYRWRELHEGADIKYMRLQFQDEFPVERATIFVRPISSQYVPGQMSVRAFNCKPTPLKLENDGFSSVTLENVPAFREEPMMRSGPSVRPWILVYYDEGEKRGNPDKYWNDVARKKYSDFKEGARITAELKQAAQDAAAAGKDENEKAILLIGWIHAHIRDLFGRQVSDEERTDIFKKMPKDRDRTSQEVLKAGIGDEDEINRLFTALATAAGLEARPAMMSSRDDLTFDKRLAEQLFMRHVDTAISVGGKWKIYDASLRLLQPGMLSWPEEGIAALITDSKKPEFIVSPISAPADSESTRTANLSLSEDGAIEGEVTESWTGHAAEGRRRALDGESAERRQEDSKDEILKVYPQAEVTALHLENTDKAELPLQLSYHIRIPSYAGRTGKRIFLQPLFFERGEAPLFSAADRQYDVVFPYPWQETDHVTIRIPAGFELERPENPGDVSFGKPGDYKLGMKAGKGLLICTRQLTFGSDGYIVFEHSSYPQVKAVFDEIHQRDQVTLSLRQATGQGNVSQ